MEFSTILKAGFCVLLAFAVGLCSFTTAADEACPTWFYYSQKGYCECGKILNGIVTCENSSQEVGILISFCMTPNGDDDDRTVVGRCIVSQSNHMLRKDGIYYKVWPNVSELENKTCGPLKRKGRLCSQCQDMYYTSTYSYDFECMRCTSSVWRNTLRYIATAYFPLTLFFIVVVLFRISVASPHLNGIVAICQFFSCPLHLRGIVQGTKHTRMFVIVKILATSYGIWNLDFFRTVIPPICLPLSTLQILALDYLVALYPLVLVLVIYALLTAYERGVGVVVLLCTPFHRCAVRLRKKWKLKHSIIDAFVTFLLLSYVKLLNTSIDFLMLTNVYEKEHVSRIGQYVYIDASVEYFGTEHLPYALSAFLVIIIVILLPLFLLFLYPMKCFQRCLNACGLNRPGLRIFMQCFQGYYRDRTDGGRECRYFAALYPAIRIIAFALYGVTFSSSYFVILVLLFLGTTLVIAVVQPYKTPFEHYNKFDTIAVLLFVMYWMGLIGYWIDYDRKHVTLQQWLMFSVVISFLPLVYFIVLMARLFKRTVVTPIQNRRMREYAHL